MADDDPPSEAELAFLQLLRQPRALRAWAAERREAWSRERYGVGYAELCDMYADNRRPRKTKPAEPKMKPAQKNRTLAPWDGIDETD